MAYNTPPTKSVGDPFTAAEFNTYIRDNFAASATDNFATKGDLFVATGANAGAALPAAYNHYLLESTGLGAALQWTCTAPQCRVYRTTAQSIADNSLTEISFDAEDADTDSFFPGSGTTVTIPNVAFGSGLYLVSGYGVFAGHATDAKLRQIGLYISGAYIHSAFVQDADGNDTGVSFSYCVSIVATTTLRMVVKQISGGALNFSGANFAVIRIR